MSAKKTSAVGLFNSFNPKIFLAIVAGPNSLSAGSAGFYAHLRKFLTSLPLTDVWWVVVEDAASCKSFSRREPFANVAAVAKALRALSSSYPSTFVTVARLRAFLGLTGLVSSASL